MAVLVEFDGPVVATSEWAEIATVTGLESSKFTVYVSGQTTMPSGGVSCSFVAMYRDSQGIVHEETSQRYTRFNNATEASVRQDFDFSSYSEGEIKISVTGEFLTVTNVGVENYKRVKEPEEIDPSKNKGISFNIERLVPRFLLTDKNGYALAKAIERAFRLVAKAAQYGIDIIQDPYKMPEWRLDELAGELGCLYDYNGSIEQKRYWIINATYLYAVYGTPQAVYNFLEGYFSYVLVEENWEYGGDPFHFRVTVAGESYDAEKIAWAQKAINSVKNVRSILDTVAIDNTGEIIVSGDMDWFYIPYLYAANDQLTNANDIADWEQMPIDPARTDDAITDEGVAGD